MWLSFGSSVSGVVTLHFLIMLACDDADPGGEAPSAVYFRRETLK